MKTDMIQSMSLEAIEVACQSAFEEVEAVFQIVEKNRNRLEYFGRLLTAAKSKVPHGKWEDWITDTFQGRLKIRTAIRWMSESNRPDLADLRREKDRTRIAGRVKVLEPSAGETTEDTPAEYQDDDPAPDMPTQRATAAGTRKKPEAEKPKTRPVVAEVLADETDFGSHIDRQLASNRALTDSVNREEIGLKAVTEYLTETDPVEVLRDVLGQAKDEAAKLKLVRKLRKELDKFDPPTKFVRPDLEEVSAYFAELKAADPDSFFDFYESKGWLVGKVSMKDWRASARKWVRENQQNGKGTNGTSGQSLDDRVAAKAARLKEIFG